MLREGDSTLTENFHKAFMLKLISKREWNAANKCRIYLKGYSVADIATGSGLEVDRNFWWGQTQSGRSRNLDWPYQGNPSKTEWSAWRRVLRLSICNEKRRQLGTTLGKWYENEADKVLPNWRWFWDETNQHLYEKYSTWWRKYTVPERRGIRTRTKITIFSEFSETAPPPNLELQRTSVHKVRDGICPTGGTPSKNTDLVNRYCSDWSTKEKFKYSITELKTERWAARKILMTESIDGILESLRKDTAVAVSDGSFKTKFGTACWILEDEKGEERIIGLIDVPGSSGDHEAYRSELAGLYGIMVATRAFERMGEMESGGLEIGCDGQSALWRAFGVEKEDISARQAHYDIISGIHGITVISNLKITTRHIKGHQDDMSEANLDKWAILNIECDLRAKDFMTAIIKGYRRPPSTMPKGMWQVKIDGTPVSTNLIGNLRKYISGKDVFGYWV